MGYPAVALLGSHLEREWVEELAFAERIFIVTDSGVAGRTCAATLAGIFGERAIVVPQLPVKDVNQLALRRNGQEIFTRLVSQVRYPIAGPSV
jgi:hypothetical protein